MLDHLMCDTLVVGMLNWLQDRTRAQPESCSAGNDPIKMPESVTMQDFKLDIPSGCCFQSNIA